MPEFEVRFSDGPAYVRGIENLVVFPHPDGAAWRKACDVCALRRHDPQGMGVASQQAIRAGAPGTVFYCIHRLTDDGKYRVCACYAAIHGEEH